MNKVAVIVAVVLACVSGAWADDFGTGGNEFTIDFVPISGDTNPSSGYGIVNNDYRMGTFEITNDQWSKFTASLGVPVTGSPSDAYNSDTHWTGTDVPTNNASWYEAAQFVNYLNTSTGHQAAYKFTGTQGTGDYTLSTWNVSEADNGTNLFRHKDAFYFMPTEDEWVKAAYWNGTTLQTWANTSPSDLVGGLPDPAKWNYNASAGFGLWSVGSGVQELNGTFNMMGNVFEWMESPFNDPDYGTGPNRGMRGGSYGSSGGILASSNRGSSYPHDEANDIGFRVASVPEPSSLLLLSLGGLALLRRRRSC